MIFTLFSCLFFIFTRFFVYFLCCAVWFVWTPSEKYFPHWIIVAAAAIYGRKLGFVGDAGHRAHRNAPHLRWLPKKKKDKKGKVKEENNVQIDWLLAIYLLCWLWSCQNMCDMQNNEFVVVTFMHLFIITFYYAFFFLHRWAYCVIGGAEFWLNSIFVCFFLWVDFEGFKM